MDDHTAKGEAFDVAIIIINIPISLVIPDSVTTIIDDRQVVLFIREDAAGLFRSQNKILNVISSGSEISESTEDWNGDVSLCDHMASTNSVSGYVESLTTDELQDALIKLSNDSI